MEIVHTLQEACTTIYYKYEEVLADADPRLADKPFMGSPIYLIQAIALYLAMVWLGPRIMANRKPIELKWTIVVYNVAMVIVNLYMLIEMYLMTNLCGYNVVCQKIGSMTNPYELKVANVIWLFFVTKIVEFADTLFFILRKKTNHISFLHVYHHSSMTAFMWSIAKWVPGGSAYMIVVMNSAIHTIMYTYYALAAIGPFMQKYLWWKKYLTTLQLLQFGYGLSVCVYITTSCKFSKAFSVSFCIYMGIFIALFANFYRKTYGISVLKDFVSRLNNAQKSLSSNGYNKTCNGKSSESVRRRIFPPKSAFMLTTAQ